MIKTILHFLALTFLIGMMVMPAGATNLPVANFSFEDNTTTNSASDGSSFIRAIEDWGIPASPPYAGTAKMSANQYASPWWDGDNVAYVNVNATKNTNYISQTIQGAVLQANHLYTLSALVGRRLDNGNGYDISYGLELLAGGNILATVTGSLNPGEHTLATLHFLPNLSNQFLGQPLEIRLLSFGTKGQSNFDNVTLTNAVVPLPGGILLVASGLLRLALRRRQAS